MQYSAFMVGIAFSVLLSVNVGRCDEQADLEKLLNRLNLVDLQIVHLEDLVQSQQDRSRQVKTARRLADGYIRALLSSADDSQRFQDYANRIKQLTTRFRETNSPSIQVMMLQAEYLRAEASIASWLEDRSDKTPLEVVRQVLQPVVPALAKHRKKIQGNIDRLSDEIGEDNSASLDRIRENQIDQLTQVLFRATYFSGWSNYYLAVSTDDVEQAREAFIAARDCFAELLGVDPKQDYREEVTAEWIDLHSIWVARSLLGLGISEAGLGEKQRSKICFDLLGHPSVPASLRSQSGYWSLQGWLNTGDFDHAGQLAKELLSDSTTLTDQQQAGICVSLVKTAYSRSSKNEQFKNLGDLGLSGLMRLRKFQLLSQLITDYKIQLESDSFYLSWLKGYQTFLAAEKTKDSDGYARAAESLNLATQFPEATLDVQSLAVCRYHLGWALFRLKKYDDAQKLLLQAFPTLKIVDQQIAQQAAWLRYDALRELSKIAPNQRSLAISALKTVINEFPGTTIARNAEYQLARLKRVNSSPAEIVKDLSSIPRDNPNYLSARYEVCLLYHQLWQEKHAAKKPADDLQQKLFDAVNLFVRESRGESHERRLRATLMATDVSLRSTPVDTNNAENYLGMADKVQSQVPSGNSALIEYHYQRFQLAQKLGDMAAANQQATWLSENGNGTAYQKSAVIALARTLDMQVAESIGVAKTEKLREAVKVYQQMSILFGNSVEALKANKNSRVTLSRLISYEMELRMFDKATEHAQLLLEAFPADENYLRKSAKAYFAAANYDLSLPIWRKLVKGTKPNSPAWYEAKYHLMYALAKTDPVSALPVYEQFRSLHPEVDEPWKSKIEELGKMLGK